MLLSSVSPVTGIFEYTVTSQVAIKPPSSVFTVTIAVPSPTAVSSPVCDTLTIRSLFVAQDTLLFVAVEGITFTLFV